MTSHRIRRIALGTLYVVAMTGVAALFCLPSLVHLADFGAREPVSLARLPARPGDSRNVTLTDAYVRPDLGFDETRRSLRSGIRSSTYYVPIVGPGWRPPAPVSVILKTEHFPGSELLERNRTGRLDVEIHDVLWEGLDDDLSGRFVELGLPPVAESFVVVTLPGETPKFGLVLTIIISLASTLGGFAIARSDPEPRAETESASGPRLSTRARIRYVVQGLVAGAVSAAPIRVALAHPTGWKNFVSWPLAALFLLFAAASLWIAWEGVDPEERSS